MSFRAETSGEFASRNVSGFVDQEREIIESLDGEANTKGPSSGPSL